MNEARRDKFFSYFTEPGVRDRLRFEKPGTRVPFNGFSFYQISYNGAMPESMKHAFDKLQEYDNEQPRRKLKAKRIQTRMFFNSKKK